MNAFIRGSSSYWLFGILSLGLIAVGMFIFGRFKQSRCSRKTLGKIYDIKNVYDLHDRNECRLYIMFDTENGSVFIEKQISASVCFHKKGEAIEVAYDPKKPKRFFLPDYSKNYPF